MADIPVARWREDAQEDLDTRSRASMAPSRAHIKALLDPRDEKIVALCDEVVALCDEVERLRAWITFTGEHQPTEDDFTEALEWERQLRQARA